MSAIGRREGRDRLVPSVFAPSTWQAPCVFVTFCRCHAADVCTLQRGELTKDSRAALAHTSHAFVYYQGLTLIAPLTFGFLKRLAHI